MSLDARITRIETLIVTMGEDMQETKVDVKKLLMHEYERRGVLKVTRVVVGIVTVFAGALSGWIAHKLGH